jgi:TP901-1 family phage major tail protein
MMAGTIRNWQIVVPGDATYTGPFQITQLEAQGPHDKEVTFSISLESGGVISAA